MRSARCSGVAHSRTDTTSGRKPMAGRRRRMHEPAGRACRSCRPPPPRGSPCAARASAACARGASGCPARRALSPAPPGRTAPGRPCGTCARAGTPGRCRRRCAGRQFRGFARVAAWKRRSASSPMPALMAHAIAPAALTAAICRGASASGPCTSRQKPACQKQRLPPPARTTLSNPGRAGAFMMSIRHVVVGLRPLIRCYHRPRPVRPSGGRVP